MQIAATGTPSFGMTWLRRAFAPWRVVALMPPLLLLAYWTFGEPALVIAAGLAPAMAALAGVTGLDQARSSDDRAMSLPTRDDLAQWLLHAQDVPGAATGQTAVVTVFLDSHDALERRFGHEVRQQICRELANRLGRLVRETDMIAALDENLLAAGLKGIRPPETENLLRLARRLQSACDAPFIVNGNSVHCTTSHGIAVAKDVDETAPSALIDAAERAGSLAGGSGAGSVRVFSKGLLSEDEDERERAKALSNALESGEIFAWFQPQMSADGQSVLGFEALARWDRPGHGIVQPDRFLPAIEKAGLSQRLTEVILKQSLTALNAWDAAGFSVPSVAVNFSGEELHNPGLADYVLWELDRFNLEPNRLVIEVLESVIADNHEGTITRTLQTLGLAGCRIDLDDFGTGFTSIINIRRFNVSRIKIDRCLVSRLDKDSEQRRMVAALLSFSQKLGIEALAEGVETERERELLRKLGCSLVQGYVFSRPLPLGETLNWLEEFEALRPESEASSA